MTPKRVGKTIILRSGATQSLNDLEKWENEVKNDMASKKEVKSTQRKVDFMKTSRTHHSTIAFRGTEDFLSQFLPTILNILQYIAEET